MIRYKRSFSQKTSFCRACLMVLGLGLTLVGCSSGQYIPQEPEITAYAIPKEQKIRADLYFYSQDGALEPEVREIAYTDNAQETKDLVQALINGPRTSELLPCCPAGTVVNDAYVIQDILFCDVSFPEDTTEEQIQEFRWALAQTAFAQYQNQYVYLTVDGVLPSTGEGALEVNPTTLTESTTQGEKTPYLLEYIDDNTGLILPQVRDMAASDDPVADIFEELKTVSVSEELNATSGIKLELTDYGFERTERARDTLWLSLKSVSGTQDEKQLAQIAMSMFNNIEGLKYIRITLDANQVRSIASIQSDRNGRFTAASFDTLKGGAVTLYFSDKEGKWLVPVSRALPIQSARDKFAVIGELIRGLQEGEDSSAYPVMLAGMDQTDFVSGYLSGHTAVVNFSERFYEQCEGMEESAERLLAYSIVNTLTEYPQITQVLFLRQGENAETLGGRILLSVPLYRNPGVGK